MIVEEDYIIEHYGVKGQKWGVRQARKEVGGVKRSAGKIRRQHKKAKTNTERKAAADKYEKEVLARVRTKDFKDAYRTANTMTKGEMALHVLMLGPLAALTIPDTKKYYREQAAHGAMIEEAAARSILREMRS